MSCNKNYSDKNWWKNKKKLFIKTFKFSNNKVNTFILFLRKGIYPYKYMDKWEKVNETSLLEKEEFYSNLNMEDTTHASCNHAKEVCKRFRSEISGWISWFIS